MNWQELLYRIHSDNDQNLSWMRVACSIVLLTGTWSILAQVLIALILCIGNKNLDELSKIEWMQPIALITAGLAGKAGQKQIEKTV